MATYLFIIIGVLAGGIINCIFQHFRSAYGVLKIDTSDSEKDKYHMYLNGDFDMLIKKKYLLLKIDHNADLSQE